MDPGVSTAFILPRVAWGNRGDNHCVSADAPRLPGDQSDVRKGIEHHGWRTESCFPGEECVREQVRIDIYPMRWDRVDHVLQRTGTHGGFAEDTSWSSDIRRCHSEMHTSFHQSGDNAMHRNTHSPEIFRAFIPTPLPRACLVCVCSQRRAMYLQCLGAPSTSRTAGVGSDVHVRGGRLCVRPSQLV